MSPHAGGGWVEGGGPLLSGLDAVLRRAPAAEADRRGDARLAGITHDSREVRPGWLFAALPGAEADGHDHAARALAEGAAALLVQRFLDLPVPQLRVRRVRPVLGEVASYVLGHPSRGLRLAAVTGTNGKTTTSLLLRAALQAGGVRTGAVGTLGACFSAVSRPSPLTTPEATDLQALLAWMAGAGADAAVLEVSSIAVDRGRVDGLRFEVAVHTGLEEEHLDYHGTVEHYYASKAALLDPARSDAAVVRVDDPWGERLAAQARVPVTTFGSGPGADVRIGRVRSGLSGTQVEVSGRDGALRLEVALLGRVNAVNAVAAYLAARHLGVSREDARAGLAGAEAPPGRHTVVARAGRPTVVVDYAHTPDALTALIGTARELAGPGARVSLVFGGRGERDRVKRPDLGRAAGGADRLVLTSHSSSGEDLDRILAEYRVGLLTSGTPVEVEPDRRRAIARAIECSAPGDVVLVAGRGHEPTMLTAGIVAEFDDSVVAAQLLDGDERRAALAAARGTGGRAAVA